MKKMTLFSQDDFIEDELREVFYSPIQKSFNEEAKCLVASLESLLVLDSLTRALSFEDLSPTTYKLYCIGAESALQKLGLDHVIQLSTESHAIGLSQSAYLSSEGVKDAIGAALKAIVAMFAKMHEIVKGLWKEYTVATSSLKKRIQKTRKLVEKIEMNDVTATFKDGSLASALKNGKDIIINDQLKNTFSSIGGMHKFSGELAKIYEHIERGLEEETPSDQVIAQISSQNFKSLLENTNFHVTDKVKKDEKPEVITTNSAYILLGNVALYIYIDTESKSGDITLSLEKIKSGDIDPDLPVMSLAQITEYLNTLEKLANAIDGFKNENSALMNKLKALLNTAQKAFTEEKRSVRAGNTSGESYSFSMEADAEKPEQKEEKPNQNANENPGDKVEKNLENKGALENKKKNDSSSVSRQYLSIIRVYIRLQGNISYMPQKAIIDGSYKLMSYMDKSLAFYKK